MRIYDDLYELIEFSDGEKEVIDLPCFQRLRRVGQTSLAHYVFPGATHTRFSHSLGVAHLAGRVADKLQPKHLDEEDCRLLRIAALLHDLGHLPLSHSLEAVYENEIGQAKKANAAKDESSLVPPSIGSTSDVQKNGSELMNYFMKYCECDDDPPKERNKPHEALSAYLIKNEKQLASRIENYNVAPADVASLVLGRHPKVYLNQLLHSDLDVDTMDYLRRDAKATGINYGEFALSYLLNNLWLHPTENDTSVLCIHKKALHTAEHFILARYFYYLQLLYHRKRMIYDYIAQAIAVWLKERSLLPSIAELEEQISDGRFNGLDDHFFFQTIFNWMQSKDSSSPTSVQLQCCKVLLNRIPVEELVGIEYSTQFVDKGMFPKQVESAKKKYLEDKGDELTKLAFDRFDGEARKASNLFETQELKDALSSFYPEFPFVIEKRSLYQTHVETAWEAEKQVAPSALEERDTIKVMLEDNTIVNINEVDYSIISALAGRIALLARYYYLAAVD